jgi:hypothetical protein
VVIQLQADMWGLDGTDPKSLHLANYRQFIDSIALHTAAFGKPVLLLNGDTHGNRSDNPPLNAWSMKRVASSGTRSERVIRSITMVSLTLIITCWRSAPGSSST